MIHVRNNDPIDIHGECPRPDRTSECLLEAAGAVVESCGATALFISANAARGRRLPLPDEPQSQVVYVVRGEQHAAACGRRRHATSIRVPDVPFTRIGQAKIALFLALTRGIIGPEDVVVCLTGEPGDGTLDTLAVVDIAREFDAFLASPRRELVPPHIQPEVVERAIAIAADLGRDGREGKPVGTAFVIGDAPEVLRRSRQLILNPFQGYAENERRLHDPRLEETVKELSSLDGAFVIRGDGVIESCGVLLEAAADQPLELPRGLGTRHHAAAAITAATDSLAIAVSESTGTVTVFRSGRILTTLKRPRHVGAERSVDRTLR